MGIITKVGAKVTIAVHNGGVSTDIRIGRVRISERIGLYIFGAIGYDTLIRLSKDDCRLYFWNCNHTTCKVKLSRLRLYFRYKTGVLSEALINSYEAEEKI